MTILYTAPTAIRSFMKWGDEFPERHDLTSLRLLGSVGEPINPEAWMWYHRVIGGERCPIVDTWWQTETGAIMISPLPGMTITKPGSATRPLPGLSADVVDEDGKSVPFGGGGFLVIDRPWPAMARTIYGDPDRYVSTYWSRFPGRYFPGDGAKRDEDGYFWLLGPGRRHHAGLGSQHLHDRSRIRPGVAPGGGGGGRGRAGRTTSPVRPSPPS